MGAKLNWVDSEHIRLKDGKIIKHWRHQNGFVAEEKRFIDGLGTGAHLRPGTDRPSRLDRIGALKGYLRGAMRRDDWEDLDETRIRDILAYAGMSLNIELAKKGD